MSSTSLDLTYNKDFRDLKAYSGFTARRKLSNVLETHSALMFSRKLGQYWDLQGHRAHGMKIFAR